MVLLFAQELAGRGETVVEWWQRRIGDGPGDVAARLAQDGQRLLVVLDGLERLPPAAQLDLVVGKSAMLASRVLFERLDAAGRAGFLAAAANAFERCAMKGQLGEADGVAALLRETGLPDHDAAALPSLLDHVDLVARNRSADEAVGLARALLAAARDRGSPSLVVAAMARLKGVLMLAGRVSEAESVFVEMQAEKLDAGCLDPDVAIRCALAEVSTYRYRGEHSSKKAALRQAERLARDSGRADWLAEVLACKAGDQLSAGRRGPEGAIGRLIAEALAAAQRSGWARLEAGPPPAGAASGTPSA